MVGYWFPLPIEKQFIIVGVEFRNWHCHSGWKHKAPVLPLQICSCTSQTLSWTFLNLPYLPELNLLSWPICFLPEASFTQGMNPWKQAQQKAATLFRTSLDSDEKNRNDYLTQSPLHAEHLAKQTTYRPFNVTFLWVALSRFLTHSHQGR